MTNHDVDPEREGEPMVERWRDLRAQFDATVGDETIALLIVAEGELVITAAIEALSATIYETREGDELVSTLAGIDETIASIGRTLERGRL